MTREQSWQVEGTTLTLLCHITSMGFTVSVFRLPRSLYGTSMAALEMRAVDLSKEPPAQHVARVGEVEGGCHGALQNRPARGAFRGVQNRPVFRCFVYLIFIADCKGLWSC